MNLIYHSSKAYFAQVRTIAVDPLQLLKSLIIKENPSFSKLAFVLVLVGAA
jgi:hypothetical protein